MTLVETALFKIEQDTVNKCLIWTPREFLAAGAGLPYPMKFPYTDSNVSYADAMTAVLHKGAWYYSHYAMCYKRWQRNDAIYPGIDILLEEKK